MHCQYRNSGLCVDKQAPTFGQICNPRACGMENNYYFIMGSRVEVYRAALDKYGEEAQTRMVYEEMAELQKELCKHARGKDNLDAIAEEIADVEIMIDVLKDAVLNDRGVARIREIGARKKERMIERMLEVEA